MKTASDLGITGDLTLYQVQEILYRNIKDGVICPCCNGPAKRYVRALTSAMAYGLIMLFKEVPEEQKDADGYIHIESYFKLIPYLPSSIRGDIPKLRFWGLIEPKQGDKLDGNPNNGYYRITEAGGRFVTMNGTVDSHIEIYNNVFYPCAKAKQINISEALKKRFDYLKLMRGEI